MSRIFAFCLLCAACTQDATAPDGAIVDMAVGSDAQGDGGAAADLSKAQAQPDGAVDAGGSAMDLDIHQPLKLVPDAVPVKQDGGVDYFELHVKPGTAQVYPGQATNIWGFDGVWPGKTVHATLGRPTTIRIFNELPVNENLSIHNHGHNVGHDSDGHPADHVIVPSPSPGTFFYDYKYPNMQQGGTAPNIQGAGTYFFHDHVYGQTAPHVYKGIEAFYIIHPMAGSAEAALNLPSGAYDIPLMIQDRSFDLNNQLNYMGVVNVNGFQGGVLVVNGTPNPYLKVGRRRYRFRLLNASNARRIDVGLSSGTMFQIATDAGLLPTLLTPARIPLAPSERAEIVIDFSKFNIGDVVTLTNDDQFAPLLPEIIQFRVDHDDTETSSLPATLNSSFVRYTETTPTTTRTRNVTFSYVGGQWEMNGQTYNPAMTEFGFSGDPNTSHLGDYEIWQLDNSGGTQIPHPFHQHLISFQILSVCPIATPMCGTQPPSTQIGWKDTVLVPPASSVRIKMQFYYNGPEVPSTIFPGNYVFHCHNLEHEDGAMMLQQNISP
jgi:FtsP/CotA-like multicopper oxidase with cupredoxin domain